MLRLDAYALERLLPSGDAVLPSTGRRCWLSEGYASGAARARWRD
jgi:hypothetical protein